MRGRLTPLLIVALLTGCTTVGPDYASPRVDGAPPFARDGLILDAVPGADASEEARVQAFVASDRANEGWWRWFGSPAIDALVAEGFAYNPTLAAARARLARAAFLLEAERGLRFPTVSASANASRQLQGGGGAGNFGMGQPGTGQPGTGGSGGGGGGGGFGNNGGGGSPFTIYTAQLNVDYNLDLFGREDRLVESARASLVNAQAEVQAAYLALAGNIVTTALEAATLRQRIAVTRELIAGQQDRFELISIRVEEGYSARAELVAAEAEIRALEARIPGFERELALTESRLAALTGAAPAQTFLLQISLDDIRLPRTVPIAVPSVLLRERPDVVAAEAMLASASADIGVAEADLYPDLTLSGSGGLFGIDGEGFGPTLDFIYSAGASLLAPLFDGGQRRARRDAQIATYQEALATYHDAVLNAFREVSGGIGALEADGEAVARRIEALDAARESLDLANFRYREGAASLFDVIQAERTFQEARLALLDATALRFQDTAALLAATGAGPLGSAVLADMTGEPAIAAVRTALAEERPAPLLPRQDVERIIYGR